MGFGNGEIFRRRITGMFHLDSLNWRPKIIKICHINRSILVFWCLISSCAFGADGGLSEKIIINNFKTGGTDYVINGRKAVISGHRVKIWDVEAFFYREGNDIRLTSPECDYDQIKKLGYGDRPVQVMTESMTINGVGFDLDVAQGRIVIRNNVRVRIFHDSKKLIHK